LTDIERARELAYKIHEAQDDDALIVWPDHVLSINKSTALILAELKAERERTIEECKNVLQKWILNPCDINKALDAIK
jgi:hypothetical protein